MSKTQTRPIFDINRCRAKLLNAGDLVECRAVEQVYLCRHALPFGYSHFCLHSQKMEFVAKAKKTGLAQQ